MHTQTNARRMFALAALGGALAVTAKNGAPPVESSRVPHVGTSETEAPSDFPSLTLPAVDSPELSHDVMPTLSARERLAEATSTELVPLSKVPGLGSYDWTVRLATAEDLGSDQFSWRFDQESGELLVLVPEIDRSSGVSYVLEVRTEKGRALTLAPEAFDSFSFIFGSLAAVGVGAGDPAIELGVRRFVSDEAQISLVAASAFAEAQELGFTVFPFPKVGSPYEWSMVTSTEENIAVLTEKSDLVRSSSFGGKVYVVEVGASWCAPCRHLHKVLSQLVEQHGAALGVVSVNIDNTELSESASQVLTEQLHDAKPHDAWHVVRIPGDSEAWALQAQAFRGTLRATVPIIVLVDANGTVVSNSLTVNQVKAAVEQLLSADASSAQSGPTATGTPSGALGPVANPAPERELSRFTMPAEVRNITPLYLGVDLFEPDKPPASVIRIAEERNRVEVLRPFDGEFYQSLRAFDLNGAEIPLTPVNRDGLILFRCDTPQRLDTIVLYSGPAQ